MKEVLDWGSLFGGKFEMKFVKEFVDFGQVCKGEKKEYIFVFYNVGDVFFIIDLIFVCDCIKVVNDLIGEMFEFGEKGWLEIIFDSFEKDEFEVIDIDIFLVEFDENGILFMKIV